MLIEELVLNIDIGEISKAEREAIDQFIKKYDQEIKRYWGASEDEVRFEFFVFCLRAYETYEAMEKQFVKAVQRAVEEGNKFVEFVESIEFTPDETKLIASNVEFDLKPEKFKNLVYQATSLQFSIYEEVFYEPVYSYYDRLSGISST